MTITRPKVSVCIPAYNREHEIREALASVLTQDFEDFEILVLDDGSTDGTRAAVARETDGRIRLEVQDRNRGIPASRNRCLELARGEYIAWLDSDDIMSPKRLSRQVACLDRHPELATLGGWVRTFYNDGRKGKLLAKPSRHEYLTAWLLFRCCHANTTLMGRADVMRQLGYREEFSVSEDYDLSVRLVEHRRVANLPVVLSRQRQHPGRTTAGSTEISFATKSRLAITQFQRIGLAVDEQDLAFHYALTRLSHSDVSDDHFVDRAVAWLSRIQTANDCTRALDVAALADVLQLVWLQTCLKLIKVRGIAHGLHAYRKIKNDGRLLRLIARNTRHGCGT